MITRLLLLASMATGLSSCGTASHLVGQASGLLSTVTAPVTGILRLSDSAEGDVEAADAGADATASKSRNLSPNPTAKYEPQRVKAQRPH